MEKEGTKAYRERTVGHQLYQKFASWFGRIYSTELNPLYNLGGLAILLFTVACISGIYVFIFYNINPRHAWHSVEVISNNYFNGWMRSIHRYSSDLLVIFIILHLLHTLISGKFKRLVSWISGIVSFIVVTLIGVTGYMLVWDQKAKLTGYLTARFFSGLPIFDPSIAGAFLLNDLSVVGGFFKVALFGHIALSLITITIIWIHVMRISKPKIIPPKKLIFYSVLALGIVSLLFPVKSDPPAQESFLPINTTFDWYYYYGYYLLKLFTVPQNWAIMIGSGVLLVIIPYIIRKKNRPPVSIDLEKCDACNLCSYDCPYEAIDMLIHEGKRKAILSPDKCVGCGICIGSCQEHAITHPQYPLINQVAQPQGKLILYTCSYFPEPVLPGEIPINRQNVPCLGAVMTKDVQVFLASGATGIALLGCQDCYYRFGKNWSVKRFSRIRPPMFSKKFDVSRVQFFTLTSYSPEKLKAFHRDLISKEEKKDMLHVEDHLIVKPVLSTIILVVFFMLMVPLSRTVVRFFDPNEKTLIVNLKYISSPTAFETSTASGSHMQSRTPVVKSRSPVSLKIFSSGGNKLLFEKEYEPRGLRRDIAMFIYSQLVLKEDSVDVELTETAFPEKRLRIEDVKLRKGDGTFVILADSKLKVAD